MKNAIYRLRLAWQQLSQREQILLGGVALCALTVILVWGIWQPMREGARMAQLQVRTETELLDWVKSKANKIESLRRAGGVGAGRGHQPLNQVITASSKEFHISLIRIQPRADELQVWIAPVAFNQLLDWINYLKTRQGIQVTALDIERGEQSGMVEIRRLQFK